MKCLKVTLLLSMLLLGGCSSLAGVAATTIAGSISEPKPLVGIDTEVVTGDKNQTGVETNETNNNNAEVVNIDKGVPFWQATLAGIVLFLLGVFMPQLTINRKRL